MSGYALDHRLVNGTRPGDVNDLASGWTHCDYLVRLERMAGFAAAPNLTAKLRGGMGNVLLEGASDAVLKRDRCGWRHESTAETLFGARSRIKVGKVSNQICAPFALTASDDGAGALVIRLRLFGLAAERGEAALLGLLTAIRHRVDWRSLKRDVQAAMPPSIEIGGVEKQDCSGIEVEASRFPLPAEIHFISPINRGQGASQDLHELFWNRLSTRMSLIAPWMGLDLSQLASAEIVAPEITPQDTAIRPDEFGGQAGGFRRKALLTQPDPLKLLLVQQSQLTALLVGEVCGIGRAAALGLGRYRVLKHELEDEDLSVVRKLDI